MQSSISLSLSSPSTIRRSDCSAAVSNANVNSLTPRSLRFCGLRREAFDFKSLNSSLSTHFQSSTTRRFCSNRIAASLGGNGAPSKAFDYDLVIIGAGVGGHGAALHAVEKVNYLFCCWVLLVLANWWFVVPPVLCFVMLLNTWKSFHSPFLNIISGIWSCLALFSVEITCWASFICFLYYSICLELICLTHQ